MNYCNSCGLISGGHTTQQKRRILTKARGFQQLCWLDPFLGSFSLNGCWMSTQQTERPWYCPLLTILMSPVLGEVIVPYRILYYSPGNRIRRCYLKAFINSFQGGIWLWMFYSWGGLVAQPAEVHVVYLQCYEFKSLYPTHNLCCIIPSFSDLSPHRSQQGVS